MSGRRGQERPSTCLFQGQPEELRGPRRSMRLVPAHGYVRRARPDRPVQAPAGSAPRGLHVLRKGCSGGCCQSWAPPRKANGRMITAPPDTPTVALGSIRTSFIPPLLAFDTLGEETRKA